MKKRLFVRLLLPVVLLVVALTTGCLPHLIKASETFTEKVVVEDGTVLEIINRNGSIDITSWDQDYIDIYAIKRSLFGKRELAKAQIKIHKNDAVIVETEYLQRHARVSVSYEIKVPAGVNVGMVQSTNGSIRLAGVKGDVTAETSNGSINIKSIDGTVSALTSNGRIDISGASGVGQVLTSNGSINVEVAEITGDLVARTSNGSVKLFLSGSPDIDLECSTSNGIIDTHGLEVTATSFSKTLLIGRIGQGGPLVSISTSNGSIDIFPPR